MARQKSGLTLLELMLVLALLAVIGSLATPAIFNSFSSVRLRRAADQVLAAWSAGRTRAIETGQPQAFRYERETGDYWLAPFDPIQSDARQQVGSGEKPTADAADLTPYARLRQLPEGLSFYVGESTAHEFAATDRTRGTDQQAQILFFPNGAATDATLVLANDREQVVRISLRGLTGIGRTSIVLPRSKLTVETRTGAR